MFLLLLLTMLIIIPLRGSVVVVTAVSCDDSSLLVVAHWRFLLKIGNLLCELSRPFRFLSVGRGGEGIS